MTLRIILAVALLSLSVPGSVRAGVSSSQEREMGERFDMMAHERIPLVLDPEFTTYVNEIGREIVGRLDNPVFDYRFSVVRDSSINAFAVPGGYVYLNLGLLNRADYDDEIAAVLGHEVAHVHGRHIVRQQEKTQLVNYASLLAMLAAVAQPALIPVAAAAGQAMSLKYQREFEQEADYLGVRYLQGTSYDPRATLDFFKKLEDETRVTPSFFPPYLRSHPLTEERLNHLEAVLKTKQWENHQRGRATMRLQRLQALARARYEKPQDVFDQYAKLRADNAGNRHADYLFGVVALETNRLEQAKSALEQARDAGYQPAVRELGRVALRQRDPATAITLLRKHLDTEPSDAMAWVELAKALAASDDDAGAKDAYWRALSAAPELDVAHDGYGLLAGRAGEQGAGFYHLGVAARLRGQYPKALESIRRALPLLDEDIETRKLARREIDALETYLDVEPEEED